VDGFYSRPYFWEFGYHLTQVLSEHPYCPADGQAC